MYISKITILCLSVFYIFEAFFILLIEIFLVLGFEHNIIMNTKYY